MFQQELQIINFEGEAIYYGPIFSHEQKVTFFDDLVKGITDAESAMQNNLCKRGR